MSDATDTSSFNNMQEPADDDMYLDRPLKEYARSFAYPATPDIAGAVRRSLAGERASAIPGRAFRPPRLAWVAFALVLLALGAALLTPDVQAFVRYLLRIGAVDIVVATPTPVVTPNTETTATDTASPPTLPALLNDLVGETTLDIARSRMQFPIRLPSYPPELGEPDLVYMQDPRSSLVVVWLDPEEPGKPRMSLMQTIEAGIAQKMVSRPEVVEKTTVNGKEAAWVRGPHYLLFRNPDLNRDLGLEFKEVVLVEGNVLLWQEGVVTYRLETTLPKAEALKVAESLVELPAR